jgi:hypothetical protein
MDTSSGHSRIDLAAQQAAARRTELINCHDCGKGVSWRRWTSSTSIASSIATVTSGIIFGRVAKDSRMMARLRADDVMVVTRPDRLARSTRDLLNLFGGVTTAGRYRIAVAENRNRSAPTALG